MNEENQEENQIEESQVNETSLKDEISLALEKFENPDFIPSEEPEDENYASPDKKFLSLIPPTQRLNKKILKIVLGALGGLAFLALMLTFFPRKNKNSRRTTEEDQGTYKVKVPSYLEEQEEDYQTRFPESEIEVETDTFFDTNELYETDNRIESGNAQGFQEIQVEATKNSPTIFGSGEKKSEGELEADLIEAAYASPILFPTQVTKTKTETNDLLDALEGLDDTSKLDALLASQLLSTGQTDYEKLNQQQQKRTWLASQKGDYSIYNDSFYTEPVAPGRELIAGTIIPIVLITGINSDLPGDISAQVLSNVYDSYTGQNLLIPKGSTVYGKYDSQIAFGQNRVLLAWDRITRPDGITVVLNGMQGVDKSGMTGVSDKIERHYEELLGGIAMGSVFDLSLNAAAAALAKLGNFGDAIGVFNENTTTAKTAVDHFVEDTLNRQPTLIVRAGFRANIIVNRNIILPYFQEYF